MIPLRNNDDHVDQSDVDARSADMTRPRPFPSAGLRNRRWVVVTRTVALAAVGVFFLLLPQLLDNDYYLAVLTQAGFFVLLGCGLNIVVSLAGLLDLGYVAFFAVGAYTAAFLSSPHFGIALPILVVIPIAVAATAIFALAIGFPTLRLRGDYLAIVTLGFGEIVRLALLNGGPVTGAAAGISGIYPPNFFGIQFSYDLEPYYYSLAVFIALAILIASILKRGKLGLIWQALRDNEIAAKVAGIGPLYYYLLAFGIGASFAGVAGVLFAVQQITVTPDVFIANNSFLVLAIVVLGGMTGRPIPVAIAAVLIVGLPEMLRELEQFRLIAFGPILIVSVILRERWAQIMSFITTHFAGAASRRQRA